MKRISSPDEMQLNAVINLVSQVLIETYKDYENDLLVIKRYYNQFLKIYKKVQRYDEYTALKKEVAKKLNRNKITEDTKKKAKRLAQLKNNLKKPTNDEKNIFENVLSAIHEKTSIEIFYKSRLFSVYSLNEIKGEEIIRVIRKKTGWTDKNEKELFLKNF